MKVKVAAYKEAIDSALDQLNAHWHACVGEKEKIYWFEVSFRVFNLLSKLECSRAKDEDKARYERAFDSFSAHCAKYEALWTKARAYKMMLDSGLSQREAITRAANTEPQVLQLTVIMPFLAGQVA